jgi:hypothetical protein
LRAALADLPGAPDLNAFSGALDAATAALSLQGPISNDNTQDIQGVHRPMTDISDLKPDVPFGPVDLDGGWEQVPGGAPGVEQKMLSGALDEEAKVGVRTR